MRSEDEKTLTEDLLAAHDTSELIASSTSTEMALPELAIPLPPPPGGENDA